jgi:hypothetical protein
MATQNKLQVQIRPYLLKELLVLYGVSRNTFKNWIRVLNLGPRRGNYYTTAQIKIIFTHFPPPHEVEIDLDARYADML